SILTAEIEGVVSTEGENSRGLLLGMRYQASRPGGQALEAAPVRLRRAQSTGRRRGGRASVSGGVTLARAQPPRRHPGTQAPPASVCAARPKGCGREWYARVPPQQSVVPSSRRYYRSCAGSAPRMGNPETRRRRRAYPPGVSSAGPPTDPEWGSPRAALPYTGGTAAQRPVRQYRARQSDRRT